MSGVSKVLVVEDHRAILDHILSHSATIFPDAQVTVISEPSVIDELEGTFAMGLIDPGLPGIPHDDIEARFAFAKPLLDRIENPEKQAVFTGIATPREREMFFDAGYCHYLSKADTGIPELTSFFAKGISQNKALPPLQRTWSFLNDSEMEALSLREQHPDCSYAELATKAQKSESAFQQALKRARKKVRDYT